jgi:two-component system NarL family sensor kinase
VRFVSTITELPRSTTTSRDLQILKTIAEALNGVADVDQALRTTLDQVARLLGLDTGWIWLLDARSGRYYGAVAQRLPPFLQEPVRMTGTACWCLRAFADGELEPGNVDVMECSRLRAAIGRERRETRGLRYHASIPLYFGGRPLGIMNVAAPAWRKLTTRELDLLSTIASQVGVAIERARLASASVHAARVEERTKLARELHDTLAQRLTAIGLYLEAAIDAVPPETPATPSLQRALELSRAGLEEARRSMSELRLPQGSLADAIEALARTFSAETGVRVHVSATSPASLPPADELEMYRIAGEALANVQKHARATDVDLTLGATPAGLRLVIADNGRGFNPRARTKGFGLIGMRERAQSLDARFRIVSRPGRGTRIELTVPGRSGR